MQFLVPLVVTMSLFGALGGQAQTLDDGTRVWIQNAGFVWVPLIMIGTLAARSEEHTSELQSLMRISYAGFCLKKKKNKQLHTNLTNDDHSVPATSAIQA